MYHFIRFDRFKLFRVSDRVSFADLKPVKPAPSNPAMVFAFFHKGSYETNAQNAGVPTQVSFHTSNNTLLGYLRYASTIKARKLPYALYWIDVTLTHTHPQHLKPKETILAHLLYTLPAENTKGKINKFDNH
jgi:hypothetical protein